MPALNKSTSLKYRHVHVYRNTDSRFPASPGIGDVNMMVPFAGGVSSSAGSTNPDWKVQIAHLQNASTSYTRKGGAFRSASVSADIVTPGPGYTKTGIGYLSMLPSDVPSSFASTDAVLSDIALGRLKRKMREHVGDFNLIVPAAQLGELRGTIRGAADLTTGLIEALINIKRTRGKSAIKYASKAWLTYGFGIAPLLSDVRSIAKAISETLNQAHTVRLTGSATREWMSSSKSGPFTVCDGAVGFSDSQLRHALSYRYIAGINISSVSSGNNYDALSHFHLEPGALLPAAWELVPWSWVADYFGTVGAFLDDTFAATPANTRYVILNRRYTCNARFDLRTVISIGSNGVPDRSSGSWEYFEFQRSSLTSLPARSLRFKTTDEMGLNSLNKLLNLASILGSRSTIR